MSICSVAYTEEWKLFEAVSLPSDTKSNAHRGPTGGRCSGQPPSSSSYGHSRMLALCCQIFKEKL